VRVSDLAKFIAARERHRAWKEANRKTLPANADPIISQFRFCNVRRNDDRVTKWIFERYLGPWRKHEHLWFALVVARLFNNEPTLASIHPHVLDYKPLKMRKVLMGRAAEGHKNFNAAYIVSTNGRAMNKIDYVIDFILTPMWKQRKFIASRLNNVGQLANVHLLLEEFQGLGSFMAAQIIADLKYADPDWWEDFHTFAASGPGSRRGLNRVMGQPVDAPWREAVFRATLLQLRDKVNARLKIEPLTAHDIQNCLCEFDKYERFRLGEGTPKQKYHPVELPWKESE
jgi:hypothetical protein